MSCGPLCAQQVLGSVLDTLGLTHLGLTFASLALLTVYLLVTLKALFPSPALLGPSPPLQQPLGISPWRHLAVLPVSEVFLAEPMVPLPRLHPSLLLPVSSHGTLPGPGSFCASPPLLQLVSKPH